MIACVEVQWSKECQGRRSSAPPSQTDVPLQVECDGSELSITQGKHSIMSETATLPPREVVYCGGVSVFQ